jgi:acyl dehydratase
MTSPQIGASARRTRAVTDRDIELFTEITRDRNPIHYDDEIAKCSRFGGIVVQGGVTTGLLTLVANASLGPGASSSRCPGGSWRRSGPVT